MPHVLLAALVLAMLVSTAWAVFGSLAILRATRRKPAPRSTAPVSVLKPLAGADPALEQNLATFFIQDHARYQLVFGVARADDPAIPVVEGLIRRFPDVHAVLVVHDGGPAQNPKVQNLLGMLRAAEHDLLLISDSNVAVHPGYVGEMAGSYAAEPEAGLVTSLLAATGENTLGSALDSVQLNGFCAAGAALPTALGKPLVIGKSMLFSRRTFEGLGGFAKVEHVLAEDFVMGKTFHHAGYRVLIAPTPVENVVRDLSIEGFFRRQLRWSMLRFRLSPLPLLLEPVLSPVVLLPFALLAFGPVALGWCALVLLLRDTLGWVLLRGIGHVWIPFLLAPARDLIALGIWAVTPFKRHVSWRGHRARLGTGTLLYATRSV